MTQAAASGSIAVALVLSFVTCIEDVLAHQAAPPEIISFVASTNTVTKGGSVTLSWQTANADTVLLGRAGTEDFRSVPVSGSESVSPDRTTTYVLMARRQTTGPTTVASKKVEIQVISPTCFIAGRVTGKLNDQGFTVTHVGLFVPGESKPRFQRRLDKEGHYSFTELPAGQNFRVAPFGKGAAAWRHEPKPAMVTCLAGKSPPVNLKILGVLID